VEHDRKIPKFAQTTQHYERRDSQHKGFFAHPENLLLAMVTDPSSVIRTLGWRIVKKARRMEGKRSIRKQDIRHCVAPQLNFEAAAYHEMIDWSKTLITEPPILKQLTDEELDANSRPAYRKRQLSLPLASSRTAYPTNRSLLIKIHQLRSAFPKNPPTAKCLS